MHTLLQKPKTIFKTILDIVLPPVCYVCGKSCSSKYGLCEDCLEKIIPIAPPFCSKCGRRIKRDETLCVECSKKSFYVEKGWSCCYYEETIKNCIHLFKYNGYAGLMDIFGDIMTNFAKKNKITNDIDMIVPVPIFSSKKRERPYNHAEVLARRLSKNISIPLDSTNLKKVKWTRSQSELDKRKREENINNTFIAVNKDIFSGKNILIVDDVYTTGSTVNECAKVLLDAGAKKTFSLTLARGV